MGRHAGHIVRRRTGGRLADDDEDALEAGSRALWYSLLCVIAAASLTAMLLQFLSLLMQARGFLPLEVAIGGLG